MIPDIWMQTSRDGALDLLAPTPAMIDLRGEVPDVLARLPRFTGHVEAGPYSVAQHMTVGAEAILAETGSLETARAFALHDAHEFALGDMATPVTQALAARTGAVLGRRLTAPGATPENLQIVGEQAFRGALRSLKADLDCAIFAAAGHSWPLPPDIAARVHTWDMRMLRTERAHLFGAPPHPWHPEVEQAEPIRLKGRLTVWPWPKAADAYRALLLRLFPHLAARAA